MKTTLLTAALTVATSALIRCAGDSDVIGRYADGTPIRKSSFGIRGVPEGGVVPFPVASTYATPPLPPPPPPEPERRMHTIYNEDGSTSWGYW
jgi:hypothetical protein